MCDAVVNVATYDGIEVQFSDETTGRQWGEMFVYPSGNAEHMVNLLDEAVKELSDIATRLRKHLPQGVTNDGIGAEESNQEKPR